MKLKTKILIISTLPIVCLGVAIYLISYFRITSVMTDAIQDSLKATAYSVADTISIGMEGNYQVVGEDLWIGEDLNITQTPEIADVITEKTGIAVTVFYGDTRYMTSVKDASGSRVMYTKAGDKVIDEVLNKGNDYFATNVDVVGENYFAYYIPLYDHDGTTPVGMIFAGKSQEKAEAQIFSILNAILGVLITVVILAVIFSILMTRIIAKGIMYGIGVVQKVSEGDLTVELLEVHTKKKDEIGSMLNAIANLKKSLTDVMGNIIQHSEHIKQASDSLSEEASDTTTTVGQVEEAVMEIAMGATSQAEETQKATEHVIVIGNMVQETNEEVVNLQQNAEQIKEASDSASKMLTELGDINKEAHEAIDIIYKQTHTTNESAKKIHEAVDVITTIAEETNLLSLNASIEAARAGEQGRGFAVVASQIQKLAEQSNQSAQEVERIVVELMRDSEDAVDSMNTVKEIMDKQSSNIENTSSSVIDVISGVDASVEGINNIAKKTKEMDEARIKVVDVVQSLTAIAEENAASTQQTSASVSRVGEIIAEVSEHSNELQKVAEELEQCTSMFKI